MWCVIVVNDKEIRVNKIFDGLAFAWCKVERHSQRRCASVKEELEVLRNEADQGDPAK